MKAMISLVRRSPQGVPLSCFMRRRTADRRSLWFCQALAVDLSHSCTPAHIRQKTRGAVSRQIGRVADHKRGHGYDQVLSLRGRREIYSLEHRFPFAATLIGVFMAGNVGSAVLMLLAQA